MRFLEFRPGIASKLTGFMLAISVLPLLIFQFVSYRATLQTITEVNADHSLQLLSNQRDYLNLQTDQIESLAENPAWAGELTRLQFALKDGVSTRPSYDDLAAKARIGQLLSGYSGLSGLDSIDLVTPQGAHYHLGETHDESDGHYRQIKQWMAKSIASPGQTVWHGIENNVSRVSNSRKVIVATKAIQRIDSISSKTEPVGLLLMNFSTEYLYDHFNHLDMGAGVYLLLVDAQHRLLFHPNKGFVGQPLAKPVSQLLLGASGSLPVQMNGEDVLLSYLEIPDKQWYMLSVVPQTTLTAPMQRVERTGIVLLLGSLLLIGLFVRMYKRQVVEPIRAVSDGFRDFEANRLDPNWRLPESKTWIQIGDLMTWFNSFLDTMQTRRQSEEDLRIAATAFESQEGIVVTDANDVILRVNRAFTEITGYSPEDAVGQKMNMLKSDHHDPDFYAGMWQSILRNGAWQGEIWNRIKNGEVHPHWLTISAVRNGDGVVTHFVGTYIDITERKRTEEVLAAFNRDFEAFLYQTTDFIYFKDINSRFRFCSQTLAAITGHKDWREMIGKHDRDVFPPDTAGIYEEEEVSVFSEGRPLLNKIDPYYDTAGRMRYVQTNKWPLFDVTGRTVGIFGISRDITENKTAEEQLRKLSLAVEQSPESIIITNIDAEIEYVNETFVNKTGYSREEAIGKNPRILHSGKTPAETYAAMWEALAQGQSWKGEFSNRRKDGSEYIEFAVITPIHQADGSITHYVAVKEDITEKKRLGEELDKHRHHLESLVEQRTAEVTRAKQQAEAANIAKSSFLANMSHEIRTPMNGILGMANILRREGVTSKQAKRLDTIDASAQHLLSVINDILDLSKIEAGKLTLEEVPVIVSSLLANVSSILSERVKAQGIHLLIETEHLPHNLVGDPTRLQQAVLNYATNAVKFTETGTVTLRARKQEETAEDVVVRFEVQDTGIGIAPEAMSRLFSSFEQADNSMNRKYGGTGLGLAITKRLAELMGGEVGADSTPGVGSTFWLTVTLTKSGETAEAATATAVDAEAEIRQRYAGQRILVADDEPVNREVALVQLEAADLVVDTAEDGAEAVTLARKNSYAAIFMDMQMPKLNGLEATREIRHIPGYRDVPIIAMTANAFAEDKDDCLNAGMNEFLSKPFKPDELFAVLLRSLSRRDL